MSGFVGLLKRTAADRLDPGAQEYLSLIQSSVTRMGRLIDDLLEFSHVGRAGLPPERRQPPGLCDQALQMLATATAGRSIEWKTGDLPIVQADPAMLRQVLVNLLDNALKFTRTRTTARIEIGTLPDESEDVVFVRDNGVGFDPAVRGQAFRRLSAAARPGRVRGHRHRPGQRAPDRATPRRSDLGRRVTPTGGRPSSSALPRLLAKNPTTLNSEKP